MQARFRSAPHYCILLHITAYYCMFLHVFANNYIFTHFIAYFNIYIYSCCLSYCHFLHSSVNQIYLRISQLDFVSHFMSSRTSGTFTFELGPNLKRRLTWWTVDSGMTLTWQRHGKGFNISGYYHILLGFSGHSFLGFAWPLPGLLFYCLVLVGPRLCSDSGRPRDLPWKADKLDCGMFFCILEDPIRSEMFTVQQTGLDRLGLQRGQLDRLGFRNTEQIGRDWKKPD